jgi:hypothetical protein
MPVTISRRGRCPWRKARTAILGQLVGMGAGQGCDLGLDGLRQQRSGAIAQDIGNGNCKTLVSATGYHSFGGEVEGPSTHKGERAGGTQ